MVQKLLRVVTALIGAALGCGFVVLVDSVIIAFGATSLHVILLEWAVVLVYVLGALLFAIIFYIFSPKIIGSIAGFVRGTEAALIKMPVLDIFFAALGLIIGLLVALLLSTLLNTIPLPWLTTPLSVVLYVLCGYLGVSVAIKRRGEIGAPGWLKNADGRAHVHKLARPKILDTSVIIDGRICDICLTGIMEGELVVPAFVLQELRHIADSADALKRGRGRRGLDIIARMQQELHMPVHVEERDYEDVAEVDAKLLRLALDTNGVVVTNDYNLNKVASVQNVSVFNINELANAIKPVVLPGEEMKVAVVKEGKESGQGVGYLDDGTMIVIDSAKKSIGEEIEVTVTSVLQTAAGRMIFAKMKG